MSVNRKNFGKSVVAGRAIRGFNRIDLSSRAQLGHETVARVERGEDGVSMMVLAAVQRALEDAGVEFPDGTARVSVRLREDSDSSQTGVVADPSMPSGTRFQSGHHSLPQGSLMPNNANLDLHRAVIAALNTSDPRLNAISQFCNPKTIDSQNDDGKTAMHLACGSSNPFKMVVIKFLQDAGASLEIQDNNGKRPLDYLED